jgi:outer membrane immunogenic protein
MRTALISTVAGLALLATPAAAQSFDWTGFYVGVHGGYFSGTVEVTDGPEDIRGDIEGPIFGGLAGYNFVHEGGVVFGVEGDFGIAHATGEGEEACDDCVPDLFEYTLNWNAHLRGRVGVPLDDQGRFVPFIAAGFALADYDVSEVYEGQPPSMLGSGVTAGLSIGAGIDLRFTDDLVGRAEVLFDHYGTRTKDDYSSSLSGVTARASLIWSPGS